MRAEKKLDIHGCVCYNESAMMRKGGINILETEERMCRLTGELVRYAFVLPKEGRIAYKILKVSKSLDTMTALYVHDEQINRQEYKMGRLEIAETGFQGRKKGHKCAAGLNSNSGFYMYDTYFQALAERTFTFNDDTGFSIARVRGFGRAVKYKNGMRCDKMIVESIVCGRRPKNGGLEFTFLPRGRWELK